jgi:hypothetical protein
VTNLPKTRSPRKPNVRSQSPNTKKYESTLNQASFIDRKPGHNYDSVESGRVSTRRDRYLKNKKRYTERTPVRVIEENYQSNGSPFDKSKKVVTAPFNPVVSNDFVVEQRHV